MPSTVLVVDDDVRIARALLTRLRAAGFDVSHAESGRIAVESASRTCPDVIILDIRLPDMSGFDVCRRIREAPATCDTPVIFLSANSSQEERRRAIAAGGNEFLAKPCPPMELLKAINHYLADSGVGRAQPAHTSAEARSLHDAGNVAARNDEKQENKQC